MKRLIGLLLFICAQLWITTALCETIVLPSGLQVIEEDAFSGDSSITEVVMPEGMTEIGDHAFGDCKQLTTINIPESVTSIAADIFVGSPNVVATVIKGSIAETLFNNYNIAYQAVDDPGSMNIPSGSVSWNGHVYKLFDIGLDWNRAKDYCEELGGHLVTITSANEQQFIESLIPTSRICSCFIGGRKVFGGSWEWVTGEQWKYTNWNKGQPDNATQSQVCIRIVYAPQYDWRMNWDDIDLSGDPEHTTYFICEWDSAFLQWADGSTVTKLLDADATETVELFTIYTNAKCHTSAPSWISLSPNSIDTNGQGGNYTIEATIQANPNAEERTGKIVISADGCKSLVLQVTQAANVPEQVTLSCITRNLGWESKGKGQEVKIEADVKGITNHRLTYTSSNPSVATVTSFGEIGYVKAVGVGETTITATTVNGVSSNDLVIHVYEYPFKWEDIKEAIKKSNATIAQLMDLYYDKLETDADAEIEKLEENVKSIIVFEKTLDPDAEKIIRKAINEVIQGLKYNVSSYKNVKTGADLARKVWSELMDDTEGGFTFTCKGITYTCTYSVLVSDWGNDLSLNPGGIVASNGKTYTWAFYSQNSKSFESEMIYLKQFADMKIQEVRDKAYSDAVKVLGISEYIEEVKKFFTNVKNTPKGKAWSVIQSQFPDLAQLVNDVTDSTRALESKYNAVKNAYNGLKPPDWTGDLGTKVVSDITGYHKKVSTFIEAVEALIP